MKTTSISYNVITLLLRAVLVVAFISAGWFIYSRLPDSQPNDNPASGGKTTLQIVLRPAPGIEALDIPVELYPIDIVAVRHEYFTERRAGTRFDDFLKERMKGRSPVAARLDNQGIATVAVNPGTWWLHAQLAGEENLEWRLPLEVAGLKQTVELTPQNIYTRTRSF